MYFERAKAELKKRKKQIIRFVEILRFIVDVIIIVMHLLSA